MKKLLLTLLFILVLSGCEGILDSGPDLPGKSTHGKNTFGCKINGKVFVPKFHSVWHGDKALYYYISNVTNSIEISAKNQNWNNDNSDCGGSWIELEFYYDTTNTISIATIKFDKCNESYQKAKYKVYEGIIYSDLSKENHFEILRYDTVGTDIIFSGTFEANIRSETGGSVDITKGRFDVKLDKE